MKKISNFFSAVNFFQFLVIKTLDSELDSDPDPYPEKCWIRIRIRIKSMRIHNLDGSIWARKS
jgi:hypothetical protein